MDTHYIQTFVEVARLENFTKAAESLNYAQSTVTMQIQRLESELGYSLFERIGHKNYLTTAGNEFLPYAMEMLRIMEKSGIIEQIPSVMTGTIRIGVLESLMFSTILSIIPKLHVQFPNINIQVRIGQADELLALLKQNHLDIAYASWEAVDDSQIISCFKHRENIIFIADAHHPLSNRGKIPLTEVLSYKFIVAESSGRCYKTLHTIATNANEVVSTPISVNNIYAICNLLSDGQSIAFLPDCAIKSRLKAGTVVKLDVDIPPQFFYSEIIYHKNKWLSPYMQHFIDMVQHSLDDNN